MARKVAFGLVLTLALAPYLPNGNAICCRRKPDFGCCGNGPCNIFCCNCDNGCNSICENTHCDTIAWLECAGVLTLCATACVVTDGELCAECMGPLYDTCKGCYSSRRRRSLLEASNQTQSGGGSCAAHTEHRDAFFAEVASLTAGPDAKGISYSDFQAYVRQMAEVEAKNGGGGPATNLVTNGLHAIIGEFSSLDADSNGFIDRREFGY